MYVACYTYDLFLLVQLKSKLLPPSATTLDPIDKDDFVPPSGQITSKGSDSQKQLNLSTPTTFTTPTRSYTPKTIHSFTLCHQRQDGQIHGDAESSHAADGQAQHRPDEGGFHRIPQGVWCDIHPTLWKNMHIYIMKTVLMYKDKDSELKRDQQRASTALVEAPSSQVPLSTGHVMTSFLSSITKTSQTSSTNKQIVFLATRN